MQHIILVGFKHVGKSVLGRQLARELQKPFIDLDEQIEKAYAETHAVGFSCREIMITEGEAAFRKMETEVLRQIMQHTTPAIITLGGGTLVEEQNRTLLNGHQVIHVTANKGQVYERIMVNGRPAFFPSTLNSYQAFESLWQQRDMLYRELADATVDNSKPLASTMHDLKIALAQS